MNDSSNIPRPNVVTQPPSAVVWRDRALWLVLLISAVVLVGRGILISSAYSETWDDQYHLIRGERFLWMDKRPIFMNDPPVGEAIIALPVTMTRIAFGSRQDAHPQVIEDAGLREHPLPPETLLMLIGIWKSLLFLPCILVMYLWARQLYGWKAGLISAAAGLLDPNFAAHVPIAALDTLGVTAIVLGCWLAWRYALLPTTARLVGVCMMVASGLLIKHTALILPLVCIMIVIVCRPRRASLAEYCNISALRSSFQPLAAGALLVFLFVWGMTLFDVSEPRRFGRIFETEYTADYSFKGDTLNGGMMNPWPAGIYLGSIAEALNHGNEGHRAFFFGEVRDTGWWSYFPIVASYKIPIGIGLIILLAIASIAWRKLQRQEWSLLIPLAAWMLFIMSSSINIGFRHFFPAYAFMLIFAGRAVAGQKRWPLIVCTLALVGTALHAASFHPNYLSYINAPRDKPYLDISDSNIDWGQSLKQVSRWLDEHPRDGKVYLGYFGERSGEAIRHYLGNRVEALRVQDPPPTQGTLILSPVWLGGAADVGEKYTYLRDREPDAVIGDCMLVYEFK